MRLKYEYMNKAYGLRTVHFQDGTAKFLSRGEKFVSGKRTRRVESGIRVKNIPSQKENSNDEQENE